MEDSIVSNRSKSILNFCLDVNINKYLVFTNENNLPVHRKTVDHDNDMEKTEVFSNFFASVFTGKHFKALNLKAGTGGKKSHPL